VLIAYLAQSLAVAWLWGWRVALLYLISLPIAADINFVLTDRMQRAGRRARAYVALRRDPSFRRALEEKLARLREDLLNFERAARLDSVATTTAQ